LILYSPRRNAFSDDTWISQAESISAQRKRADSRRLMGVRIPFLGGIPLAGCERSLLREGDQFSV